MVLEKSIQSISKMKDDILLPSFRAWSPTSLHASFTFTRLTAGTPILCQDFTFRRRNYDGSTSVELEMLIEDALVRGLNWMMMQTWDCVEIVDGPDGISRIDLESKTGLLGPGTNEEHVFVPSGSPAAEWARTYRA